jgi:hypothetical protein
MIERPIVALAGLLALPLLACGSSNVASGAAVSKVGQGISTSAQVPQGAEVCMLQDALASGAPGAAEKPATETCSKAIKSDQLWRHAMAVLSAHADRIGALSAGAKPENTGQLQAALIRVPSGDPSEPSDPPEQAARVALTQLESQLNAADSKADLSKVVQDAAQPVKTICDGLTAYLDKQVQGAVEVDTEVEKRRSGHKNVRCGKAGEQVVCVSESFLDRIGYADLYKRAATIADSHAETRDTLGLFCTLHQKLADAAAKGNVDKDATYNDVLATVKAAPPPQPPSSQPPFTSPSSGAKSNAPAAPASAAPPAGAKPGTAAPPEKK